MTKLADVTAWSGAGDLEELHGAILEAWNRHDEQAYAGCFTDDALVVGFDGSDGGRDALELARLLATKTDGSVTIATVLFSGPLPISTRPTAPW